MRGVRGAGGEERGAWRRAQRSRRTREEGEIGGLNGRGRGRGGGSRRPASSIAGSRSKTNDLPLACKINTTII